MIDFRSRVAPIALVTVLAFSSTLIPRVALAQNSGQAEVFFKEGKQLLSEKKFTEACKRFAASQKLDPAPNTLMLLAYCHDQEGKTASAYGEYLDAAGQQTDPRARAYAEGEAKKLEGKLLKVRIEFPNAPGDVAIKIDDDQKAKDKDFIGVDIPIDPGEHDIEVTASKKKPFKQHFVVSKAQSPFVLKVALEDAPVEVIQQPPAPRPPRDEVVVEPADPVKRWIGVGLMAAGVGAIAYGVYALVQGTSEQTAFNKEGQGLHTCDLPQAANASASSTGELNCHHTDSDGLTYGDRANRYYIQAGVVGGLGIVSAAVGTILLLTSFESKKTIRYSVQFAPSFSPTYAGMGVFGTF